MQDLTVDLGLHGAPSLFHVNNGFYYRCYRVRGYTAYLRCTEFRLGCPARGLARVGGHFHLNNEVHNHEPNFQLIPYLEERRILIEEAKRLDIASFQEIFNHRRIVDSDLTNNHLYRSMLRARMDVLPQLHNLRDLLNALENQSYTCISATRNFSEILFKDSSRLPNGSTVLLFMSSRCSSFLQIAPDIFIVQSLIGASYDLLTIGCLWEKRVVCLGFILMDGRTAANFNAAFYLLRTHLNTWIFQEGICGEANPLPSAFSNTFGVPLYPSLYDFIRDAKSFILNGEVMQSPEAKYLLGLCFTLTLLPWDIMPVGVLFIQAEFCRLQGNNIQLFLCMQEILQMPHFSICADKDRTHFGIERLRDQLNRYFANFDGNIYAIIRYIVSSTEKSLIKIDSIGRAERPPAQSPPSSLLDDSTSKQLFKDLIRPPLNVQLSVVLFMQAMVGKLNPFLQ